MTHAPGLHSYRLGRAILTARRVEPSRWGWSRAGTWRAGRLSVAAGRWSCLAAWWWGGGADA